MYKIARILIILACLIPPGLKAQQPANYESFATYREALDLFQKEKYGAAQDKFAAYIAQTQTSALPDQRHDLRADAQFYQGVCNFHLLRNNAQSQLEQFANQFPTHPKANESYFYIGKLYFVKRDYPAAGKALEDLSFSPLSKQNRDEARFMLGYCYLREGRKREAADLFNQARRGDGQFAEQAAYYYAMLKYDEGDYQQALEGFNSIPEKSEFSKDIPILKANCLLKLRNYDELEAYASSLESGGRMPTELYLVMGNAAYDQKNDSKVISNLESFQQRKGKLDRSGAYRLGISYYRQHNYQSAREQLERVGTPMDSLAQVSFYYLGHCFLKLENYENARTAFRKASEQDFDKRVAEEALFQYAKASFETRYFEESLAALQKMEANYPNSPYRDEVTGLIGEILLFANNYKEAIEYFETTGGLNTERARKSYQRACYLYGLELYEKRLYDKSADLFKTAFNQRKDAEVTSMAYYWYSESKFRAGDYGTALQYYETFLSQPNSTKSEYYDLAYYGMAWCYMEKKDYGEASKKFEKFLAIADKQTETSLIVDASLRAGDCEYVEGRYQNAIRYYRQVRDYNNANVDYALYRLGQTYFRVSDFKNSIASYDRLVKGYKKSEYRDEALNNLSDLYLTWEKDWPNTVATVETLLKDHPSSTYIPGALNRAGIAQAESKNNTKAQFYFKTVVLDHCYDREAALDALRFLSSMLESREYDRIYSQYKEKCPADENGAGSEQEEKLAFSIMDDRYHSEDYTGFLGAANNYLRDYPKGNYVMQVRYWRAKVNLKQNDQSSALADLEYLYNTPRVNEFTVEALNDAAEIQTSMKNYLIALELYSAMEQKADKLEDRLKAVFGKAQTQFAMGNYEEARQEYMALYNDPNTTEYSKARADLQIGNCLYMLGRKDEAFEIFTRIEKAYDNAFAAEAQYMITRILFDRGQYEQSQQATFYLKDKYPKQNYWKAKAYMVLAESYLALGDTFQAVEGTLESLAKQDRFPDIQADALKRIEEINASRGGASENNNAPEEEDSEGLNKEEDH